MVLYCPESQDRGRLQSRKETEKLPCLLTQEAWGEHTIHSRPLLRLLLFPLSIFQYFQKSWPFLLHSWKWNGKGSSTGILIQDGCLHGKITEVIGFFQRPSRKNRATVFRSHFSSFPCFPNTSFHSNLISSSACGSNANLLLAEPPAQ